MSEAQPTAVQLLHPYYRDKLIAKAEAAEAATRHRQPDPRVILRQAHADRAAAREEMSHLAAALERARQHHAEVERHHAELAGEVEIEEEASTEALIAELIEGMAGRPSPSARRDG